MIFICFQTDRAQLPAIKANGEESCSIKSQPALEQDTAFTSNWKYDDIADSCSLGSETSSVHSGNVSYLPELTCMMYCLLCTILSQ